MKGRIFAYVSTYLRTRTLILCVLLLGVLLVGVLGYVHVRETPGSYEGQAAQAESHWRERIRAIGPTAAYEEFAQSVAGLEALDQHSKAHVFGAALYHEIGLKGASICDERFGQGCLHEFIGLAVVDRGVAVLDELHAECQATLGLTGYFCEHGVGHGLMTYFGVTDTGLKTSLKYCDKYESEDPLNGCYTGSFMEYFERNVTVGDDSPRPVENGNYSSICGELSGTSHWLCFYSLPRWWHQLYKHQGMAEEDIFPILRDRCLAVPEDMRSDCFNGLGHITPSAVDYSVPKTIQMCAVVTQGNVSLDARCRAHAANDFLLEVGKPEALQVCEGLSGASFTFCHAYATIIEQKTITVPAP